MNTQAKGTFTVALTPEPPYDTGEGAILGRVSISKQFEGDLVGTSNVQMLSAITDVKGSAGYVAIERVSGTLQGRAGTFVLQHSGTMARGKASLIVTVVADSGTGSLKELTGQMTIDIVDGKHYYTFDYALPATA